MLWSELRLILKTSSVTSDFFLRFLSNLIIFYRQSKFQKNLCMGNFWARTSLRTFAPIVSAHPYCAREWHATSCIERARNVLKWTNDKADGHCWHLCLELTILDVRVSPTFLFRNRFYLQLSTHCPKMNKKSMWEVKKNSRFLSTGHGILPSFGCKAREAMVAKCQLVLWGTSPVD